VATPPPPISVRGEADPLGVEGGSVIAFDLEGRLVALDEDSSTLTGWHPTESVGRQVQDLLDSGSLSNWSEALRTLAGGDPWTGTLRIEGGQNEDVTVVVAAQPVTESGAATVVGATAVLQPGPATGREQRIRLLETIVMYSPDAVVAIDRARRVSEWNVAAERMFGWTRAELLGTDVGVLIPTDCQSQFAVVLEELGRGTRVPPYETVRLNRDGSRLPVQVHAVALRDNDQYVGAVATYGDLSERQQQERQLAHLLSALPVVVATFDSDATVSYAAGGGYERDGTTPSLAHGLRLLDAAPAGSALHHAVTAALDGSSSDLRVTFDDRLWQVHVAPLGDGDAALLGRASQPNGGLLSAVDITTEHQVSDRLAEVLAATSICLSTFDADGIVTYAAGSGYARLGVEPQSTVGLDMFTLFSHSPPIREAVRSCLEGRPVDLVAEYADRIWDLHYRPYPGRDGTVSGGMAIAQDATGWLRGSLPDGSAHEPQVGAAGLAMHEPLLGFLERDDVTGLLGRRGLQRRLSEPVPTGHGRAVAVLDVDAFSLINETYGTTVADKVLRTLGAQIEQHCLQATLGRWHADEFVIVLDSPDAGAELERLIGEILTMTRKPLVLDDLANVDDLVVHVGMSAGLVTDTQSPTDDLPAAARQALHAAKQAGRDRLEWYQPQMTRTAGDRIRLAQELRTALTAGQLRLHYQPIVHLASNHVTEVEALVRWEHPREGLLPPAQFIEMAERTGLIVPLGAWVLEEACRTAAAIAPTGPGWETVAVNLSAQQLTDPELVTRVQQALDEAGCAPTALTLEVTETAVMTDLSLAVSTMQQLKELGVGLTLDDFGTGYSSLMYLKHFPVDTLKIDRSFVAGLGTNADDSAIVASTISLARTLGISCVAEGVERIDQLSLLTSMGCDYAQGYLFSRPQPLPTMLTWLAEHTNGPRRWGSRVPAPQEDSADVATILQMHAEAASLHTIAAALNNAGRRTNRDTRWSATSVAKVIATRQFPTLHLSG
jgi:PAS domain S-box-containing protein/diguanylate cyclase (GGDEF)-like protein